MKTFHTARKYGVQLKNGAANQAAKLGALALLGMATVSAHAQSTGIDSLFDEIDLSGLSTKILALAVLIVGIAFVIKGPSIVKRIISKV